MVIINTKSRVKLLNNTLERLVLKNPKGEKRVRKKKKNRFFFDNLRLIITMKYILCRRQQNNVRSLCNHGLYYLRFVLLLIINNVVVVVVFVEFPYTTMEYSRRKMITTQRFLRRESCSFVISFVL